MTSVLMRWGLAAAAAAAFGVMPVALAPVTVAAPCADPAMCHSPGPNEAECIDQGQSSVCVRAGDAELHSAPDPAVIPEVPNAEMPPWQVLGAPGENRGP